MQDFKKGLCLEDLPGPWNMSVRTEHFEMDLGDNEAILNMFSVPKYEGHAFDPIRNLHHLLC